MIIVDAHLDLAWNMLTFDRDYTRSAAETRQLERGKQAPELNGDTMIGWPDFQRGRVAVVFSTLFAAPIRRKHGQWDTQCYRDSGEAFSLYSEQLDIYDRLLDDHADKFRLVKQGSDLEETLSIWSHPDANSEGHPVGLVMLMEGAEGVRAVRELESWWMRGVRIIGPAWAGNRFCGGTGEPGKLTQAGYELLDAMAQLGFLLDLSHMDEEAAVQALEHYPGVILASHANARALLNNLDSNRHLTDRLIQGIIERAGVIGIVPMNPFLVAGWKMTDGRDHVTLEHIAAQIDHICQIAGDAEHVGIGSDFDGGFGLQSAPIDIDTIADLVKLAPFLDAKGYTQKDIDAIFGANWIRCLKGALP